MVVTDNCFAVIASIHFTSNSKAPCLLLTLMIECTSNNQFFKRSDGMQNVSKNMFKNSDDSSSDLESDDERLEGWKPPAASGVDNSKALATYEDVASRNVGFRCPTDRAGWGEPSLEDGV